VFLFIFFDTYSYLLFRYIPLPITGGATNVVEGTEAGKKKLDVWLPVGHRPTDPNDVSGELHLVVEFIPVSVCFFIFITFFNYFTCFLSLSLPFFLFFFLHFLLIAILLGL